MCKLPLSVVIIAKNAEKHLDKCLKSISDIASEIVVVVNDCTDKTVKIAETYNSVVIENPWESFSKQKNFAISKATQKWVLSLDTDEAIDCDLKKSIKQFISTNKNFTAAKFKRMTFFLGKWIKHGDWYPDYNSRLFLNKQGQWSDTTVHEKIEVKGKICTLKGNLLHYSFESLNDHILKNIKYCDLAYNRNGHSDKRTSTLSVILHSSWKFFKAYILKRGFLDGFEGYYIAKSNAFLTLYKYANQTKHSKW